LLWKPYGKSWLLQCWILHCKYFHTRRSLCWWLTVWVNVYTFKDEIKVIIDLSHCWEKHCETSLAGCFYWVFLNIRRLNKSSECWKHGNYINELLFVAFAWVAFRANRFILHFHTSRSLNWLHKSGGHTAILFSIIDDTRVRISSYYNFG
jgi:hypothetical protein